MSGNGYPDGVYGERDEEYWASQRDEKKPYLIEWAAERGHGLMGAREELAAIRERVLGRIALPCADCDDDLTCGCCVADQEMARLVKALEAVLETADEWAASPAVGASSAEQWEFDTLRNAARSIYEDLAAALRAAILGGAS